MLQVTRSTSRVQLLLLKVKLNRRMTRRLGESNSPPEHVEFAWKRSLQHTIPFLRISQISCSLLLVLHMSHLIQLWDVSFGPANVKGLRDMFTKGV